jgi:CubicO group peptidase (beta-lactamase class C family)
MFSKQLNGKSQFKCSKGKRRLKYWRRSLIAALPTLFLVVLFFPLLSQFYSCAIDPKLQAGSFRTDIEPAMRSVFEEYEQSLPKIMKRDNVPGLSIAVIDRDGILWTAGFGHTDLDQKTPATPDTIFFVCSMSKTFTATAVMYAVQDRIVDLDEPIITYLPDFMVSSSFEADPQEKITLRYLLNHTSGLAHETTVGNSREPSYATLEEHVKSISDTWLRQPIGEKHRYSGLGFDLAAYIIQVRSGKAFSDYLKERIFDPLGMSNSSLDTEFIRNHPSRAIGYYPHVKKLPLPSDVPYVGAGGVYTSARDLARFVQFHLNQGILGGKTILEERLVKEMCMPSTPSSPYYGLGINSTKKTTVNLFHAGGGYGFRSYMLWLPEYGIGCLVLTNSEYHGNSPWDIGNSVLHQLVIERKLVEKRYSFDIPPREGVGHEKLEAIAYQRPDQDSFTPYKSAWRKYIGTYRYMMSGWKLHTYAQIGLALGYSNSETHAEIRENNGYLEIDGARLNEHLPGLFFTIDGQCLDFRGPVPTWKNYRIKKTK